MKSFSTRRLDVLLLGLFALIAQGGVEDQAAPKHFNTGYPVRSIFQNSMLENSVVIEPSLNPVGIKFDPKLSSDGTVTALLNGKFVQISAKALDLDPKASEKEARSRAQEARSAPSPTLPATQTGQLDENCSPIHESNIPQLTPDYSQRHAKKRDHRQSKEQPERTPATSDSAPNSPPAALPTLDTPPKTTVPSAEVAPPDGAPIPNNSSITQTFGSAATIGDFAKGHELVDSAIAAHRVFAENARHDQRALEKSYKSLGLDAMAEHLNRAQQNVSKTLEILDQDTPSTLDSSDKARFRNHFLNARDKAQLGLDAIRDDQRAQERSGLLGSNSPLSGLLGFGGPKNGDPLSKNPALADIFGGTPKDSEKAEAGATAGPPRRPASHPGPGATSNDALTNRIVMLNGLPDEERERALEKLKLLEASKFTLRGGKQITVSLPHNGYMLGGGATAVDCSSFVSSLLPADLRKSRFTTLDFRSMWIYGRTAILPSPPKYSPERAALIKKTASAFIPIDLYDGETLKIGDILNFRFERDPIGHVVVVRSYNPDTMRAEIIEASQSAGGVRERTLNLSADPLSLRRRYLIPGLWALRLKPVSNHACTYRKDGARNESARTPASQPESVKSDDSDEPETPSSGRLVR